MSEYDRFVVPYDFSEHSSAALEKGVELAQRLGADIHLVHVVQHPAFALSAFGAGSASIPMDLVRAREEASRSLEEVANALPVGVSTEVLESARISDAIREVAEKKQADLVVMGTHGRTGLAHVFLGSVAERTLRDAPCPVLTVRAVEKEGMR